MSNVLIKGALGALTGEATPAARLPAVDVRVAGGMITEMAPDLAPQAGESVLDAGNCVLYPGLVNTHHHMFQSLIKGVPAGLNEGLGLWLRGMCTPRSHSPRPSLRPAGTPLIRLWNMW